MPMPAYDDPSGGLPPVPPLLGWQQPDPTWTPPPHWGFGGDVQPELGAAVVPPMPAPAEAPQFGPQPAGAPPIPPGVGAQIDALAAAAPPLLHDEPGMGGAPALPYGADQAPSPPPPMIGPPAPHVADLADVHIETHAEQLSGHPWDNPVQAERDAAARSMAINDPVAFQAYSQHLAEAKVSAEAAARAQVERDNLDAMKQDIADRQRADAITQAKSDQIVADAMRLASKPLDRQRWFRNKTTGQQLATIGVALVGGLLQGANGGRNTGMDWITGSIDKDIDDQKADIENQRAGLGVRQGAVAQEFARTGNLYQATETVRVASYQAALNQLQTEQQNYDPRGTSFAAIGHGMQQLIGARQQAIETQRKEMHTEALANLKEARETAAQLEAARHNKAEEAKGWAQLDIERNKTKADNTLLTPAQIVQQYPSLPTAAIPPRPMTAKALAQHVETYNKTLETAAKTVEGSPEERARRFSVGEITDDKGAPVTFRNEDFAGKLADSKASADDAVRIIDQTVALRKKYGWSSDLVKRPEWRQLQANYASLLLAAKTQDQLGVLSASDIELEAKKLGTADPTETKDPTPGLLQARKNIVESINAKVRGQAVLPQGRKLARWEPKDLADIADADPSPEETLVTLLKSKPDVSYDKALEQATHFHLDGLHADSGGAISVDAAKAAIAAARQDAQRYKDISPQQERALEVIAQRATSGDVDALATLRGLASANSAKNGGTDAPGVRQLAKAALAAVQQSADAATSADALRAMGFAPEADAAPTSSDPVHLPALPPPEPTFPGGG